MSSHNDIQKEEIDDALHSIDNGFGRGMDLIAEKLKSTIENPSQLAAYGEVLTYQRLASQFDTIPRIVISSNMEPCDTVMVTREGYRDMFAQLIARLLMLLETLDITLKQTYQNSNMSMSGLKTTIEGLAPAIDSIDAKLNSGTAKPDSSLQIDSQAYITLLTRFVRLPMHYPINDYIRNGITDIPFLVKGYLEYFKQQRDYVHILLDVANRLLAAIEANTDISTIIDIVHGLFQNTIIRNRNNAIINNIKENRTAYSIEGDVDGVGGLAGIGKGVLDKGYAGFITGDLNTLHSLQSGKTLRMHAISLANDRPHMETMLIARNNTEPVWLARLMGDKSKMRHTSDSIRNGLNELALSIYGTPILGMGELNGARIRLIKVMQTGKTNPDMYLNEYVGIQLAGMLISNITDIVRHTLTERGNVVKYIISVARYNIGQY